MARERHPVAEKGSYVLVLRARAGFEKRVGSLGNLIFNKGFYAYIGSAFGPGGIGARVARHSRREKVRWHIDYILDSTEVVDVFVAPGRRTESELARACVAAFNYVRGFGCSDKRSDVSHLLYLPSAEELSRFQALLERLGFRRLAVQWGSSTRGSGSR